MLYSPVFRMYPHIFQSDEAYAIPYEAFIGFFKI